MTVDIKNAVQYKYKIEEIDSDWEVFTVLHPKRKDIYDIAEEAARLYYYGRSGWAESWPLTFVIRTVSDMFVAKAFVFVCSATPDFDVVISEKAGSY
jgi:hypothetical protein